MFQNDLEDYLDLKNIVLNIHSILYSVVEQVL